MNSQRKPATSSVDSRGRFNYGRPHNDPTLSSFRQDAR